MADAEVSSRPYVATYGRRQQRREETPLSDVEGQPSQPSPRPRDALFLDSSPVHNGGASRRSRNATNDDETGNTSASSSDDARQATSKSRSTAGGAARTRPELSRLISDDSDDDDDDNAGSQNALDRIRAQLRGPTSSGNSGSRRDATSSLSSAPSLSQPSRAGKGIPGLSDSEDDEADRTMTSRPSRVGLLAGRMKARITTTSSNDGPSRSLPSQRSTSPRRSFTLSDDDDSASSLSDSAPDSQVEQSRKDRLAATQRKQKLEQMAAKRRQATAAAEPEVEVSLEDDFFNQADEEAPATDDPIRSSSTAGHDDDSDEDLPDAREVARRAAARGQQPGGKASGSRDKHKSSSKSQKAAKAPKGPKPLSKKEQEEMRKMQAKIERSRPMPSLALQSHPVDRQEYSIAQLAAKFKQQPETQASPESDDPIEMDTPRRPVAVASAAKSKPSLPSPASLLPQTGRSSDSIVVSNAEDAKRRKAQEALRLRKQKWLQSQEENAQRPFMSAATADSIESQGSDDLVFDLAGPSRNGKDNDDDDLILVDTPKGGAASSKGKVASRLFAGKLQERSTNGGAAKSKAPPSRNNSRQAPPGMSTTDFKQSMLDKIKRQNISIRAAREQQAGPRAAQQQTVSASTTSELTDESSADALKRVGERAKGQPDAEDEVDDDGDAGSEDDDFAPEGSGSEEEEDEEDIEESGAKAAAAGNEDEEEDPLEDEEDIMPPSSQNTNRSLGRTGMENDDSDDDEDEELHTARPSKKRGQRVVADEEDEEELQRQQREQEEEHDAAAAAAAGPSSTSRPAHSFGGPAGLTQFFQDTQASAAAVNEDDHPESESQKLIAAEAAAAAAAAAAGGKPSSTFAGPRPTNDSVLGQFFADTQLSESPRGQSLDVIGATGRARNADHFAFAMGESSGSGVGGDALSQFFNEGTQVGTRDAVAGEQPPQPFAVGSMGPPTAIPADGFAALRRQAQGDGQDLLGSPDSVLPTPEFSGDEHGLDSHLKTPQSVSAAAAPKQYLNHEGFFTQTRPVAPAPESAGGARSVQGGDSFGANASQWAGESSSQLQQQQPDGEGESYQEPSSPSADTARRKRFRRAAMPDEEDSEEEEAEQHEDEEEEEEDDGDSRGSASDTDGHDHLDNVPADSDASDAEDDDVHPGATANAWEVLKRAAQRADQAKAAQQPKDKKKRRHQYIEGEAEESEDEEGGPTRKAGGLKGVFDASDDEENDEDSDEEDDGADLEGLVDDVKERDEAAKDKLALARYQQDLDVDEAAALALAEKAAKGELRGKRRKGRDGQGGLEDLLDDDFDEERLKRMASRPKGWVSKRRKLEGGDGMDLLASKAESRAFVEGYAETHQSNVGGDEYSFLAGAEDEEEDEEDSDEDEDEDEDEERDAAAADDRPDDDLDELDRVFAQRITRKELAKELQERRKKRRRLGQLASDDEEEEEQQQRQQEKASMPPASRDFFATDESDNEDDNAGAGSSFRRGGASSKAKALPSYLHDRINSTTRPSAANTSHNKRNHARAQESDDEDEDHDASADPALALVEGLKRRRAVSPRTAARLAKVAAEYGDRNEAYTGAQGGGGGGGGSSITSFGARAARQQQGGGGGVDRQKAGAGAFAQAKAGGAADREGRRPMGISSSASSGLLAKRVVEESQ